VVCRYDGRGLSCKPGTFNVLRLDTWVKPAGNGLASNPDLLMAHGDSLLSSLSTFGNLETISSLSPSALANFQTFVDTIVGKGMSPNADAIARLRRLYDMLRRGPVVVHGVLEYELCVCKGKVSRFERQESIKDDEFVLDGNDRSEIVRVKDSMVKYLVKELYKCVKGTL